MNLSHNCCVSYSAVIILLYEGIRVILTESKNKDINLKYVLKLKVIGPYDNEWLLK